MKEERGGGGMKEGYLAWKWKEKEGKEREDPSRT